MTDAFAHHVVDVAVVGAGPGGLCAARAAAQAGAQVTLLDAYRQPGGQYFRQTSAAFRGMPPMSHQHQGKDLWQQVQAAGVNYWPETLVWGGFGANLLALYHSDGSTSYLQAQVVILATGTYERAVAFPGWTLPGVMTVGAAQALLKGQRILPGRRIVMAGTGPLQLVVAAALVDAGAEVVAVLEGSRLAGRVLRLPLSGLRSVWGQWERLAEGMRSAWTLRRAGVPVRTGWGITAAHGDDVLTGVTVAPLDEEWRPLRHRAEMLQCDTLCVNHGFVPNTELAQLLGVHLTWRPRLGGFVPVRNEHMRTNVPTVYVVGDAGGIGGAAMAMVEGEIAGRAAAKAVGAQPVSRRALVRLQGQLRREQRFQQLYGDLFTPGPGIDALAEDSTIVCRCEEVTQGEVREAVRQGADTIHAVKSLTRCGMGNCQGRMCASTVANLVACESGQARHEVGYYRVRPPLVPIPLSALAPEKA